MTSDEVPQDIPGDLLKLPTAVGMKNADTRMKDAKAARALVQGLLREDEARSLRRTIVKGCYNGNPSKRSAPGFAWECRLNFGEMEGLMDSARIPYYALFSGVQTYACFSTNFQRENPKCSTWNKTVEQKFTEMLDRWKQFRWHMKAREFEMLFEGWGPLTFDDPNDWRFTSFPARCIKVPQGAYSSVDDRLPFIVLLRDYRVHELWAKIADPEAATARGWNIEQVKFAIQHACNRRNQTQQQWEYWEQKLKNADLAVSFSEADIIRCAKVFLMEYAKSGKPGRVSEFMLTVDAFGTPNQPSSTEVPKDYDYLYSAPNQFKDYSEAMNIAFQNTGDGTWHSVRGLAIKAFKHVEVNNRLLCQIVNNSFLGSTVILKSGTNAGRDSQQLMVLGSVAQLAPGVEIAEARIAADVQGPMAASRIIQNHLAQNIGQYNQRTMGRDDGRGEQPTAHAVELQASKETSLSQAQIDSYYDDNDQVYTEVFNRAKKGPDEESKRFLRECLEAGVPLEAIEQMGWVKANRLSGYPSPEARKRNFREAWGMMTSLPEQGKVNLTDEGIGIFMGPDKIDVFNPKVEQPNMDAAFAQMENAAMDEGVKPILVSGMDAVVHLQIHLAYAAEKLQPLHDQMDQEGSIDPEQLKEAYDYVSILGPHCEEHLAQLQNDPTRKGLYETFSLQLKNIAAFHGKLRGAILDARRQAQQAALEQQNAQALGAIDQAKLASVQAGVERDNLKAASDMHRKDVKQDHSLALKTFQVGATTKLAAAKTMADVQIKKTAAENKPAPKKAA